MEVRDISLYDLLRRPDFKYIILVYRRDSTCNYKDYIQKFIKDILKATQSIGEYFKNIFKETESKYE